MCNTSVLCTSFSSRSSWATFSASAAGTDTAAARGPEAAKAAFGESAEDTDSAAAGAADIVELIFVDFDAEAKELCSHGHEETSKSRPAGSDRGRDLIFAVGVRDHRATSCRNHCLGFSPPRSRHPRALAELAASARVDSSSRQCSGLA